MMMMMIRFVSKFEVLVGRGGAIDGFAGGCGCCPAWPPGHPAEWADILF
jgi:hypothetical protein